ncbi:hypothetical protein P7K49_009289, partial [Saguinus oedipus]
QETAVLGRRSVLGSRLLAPGGGGRCTQRRGLCAREIEPGPNRRRRAICGGPRALGGREKEAAAASAGMSRTSKVVLGLSVLLTAATVAGVHVKQRWDQQ